ncbi:PH domain-containing protein [Rhodococcoides kyotonense]|uniref:PH domain-containing protein n=1 Tax=Rhodococcoides kyotonense TaxID=398843 RepID=A0A239KC95_9NOCA|nr:PH domain-containing protein [Rhodococcus kyotonensis]SNT14744.1 PH domain-containing protein [Rhodococcus kyotonensis]
MWITSVDNFENDPQDVHNLSWATPISAVVALAVGGLALVTVAFVTDVDPAGRFLVTAAALGLWIISGSAAFQRPRLWINDGSLSMKRLTGVRTYRPDEIKRVKLVRYPRLGRRVPMLELDVQRAGDDDDRLVIFGRWDLGTNPQDAYDALERHGLVPPGR